MKEVTGTIRNAMIETGRMSAKCRLECIEALKDGDWMRVGCHIYKTSRTKKPHMYWNICVYVPKNQIHWDTTTFYYL